MNETSVWMLGTILTLIVALLGWVLWLLYSRTVQTQDGSLEAPEELSGQWMALHHVGGATPFAKLTLDDALDPPTFSKMMSEVGEENLLSVARRSLGDSTGAIISGAQILRSGGNVQLILSPSARESLSTGKWMFTVERETGRLLPTVRDTATGKIKEIARFKPDQLTKLANMGQLVVNIAHVISGADIMKQVKSVKKDTTFLVAARRIDQYAELEAIYSSIGRLLSLPRTEAVFLKLLDEVRALDKIRSQFRREIELALNNVQDPNQRTWLQRLFTRQVTMDRQVVEGVSEAEIRLSGYLTSLQWSVSLHEYLGSLDHALRMQIPYEHNHFSSIVELFNQKKRFLSDEAGGKGLTLDPVQRKFKQVQGLYVSLVKHDNESAQVLSTN